MHPEMELYKTAAMTFEELGFLFPLPHTEQPADATFEASASVDFHGALNGKLVISVYGDIMPTLAANMLGSDDIPPVEQQCDALGEVANVVCGNVLPTLTGPREIFKISAPQISRSSEPAIDKKPASEADIALMEGRAHVSLYIN